MYRTCRLLLAAVIMIGAATVASPVRAQYRDARGFGWSSMAGATWSNMVTWSAQDMENDRKRKELLDSVRKGKKPGVTKLGPLLFKPTAQPLVVDLMANAIGGNAEEKKALATLFREGLREVRGLFQKMPGDSNPDDLAKAFAFYITANYTALHPGFDLSDTGGANLIRQMRAMAEGSSGMAKATDREKQTAWETLVIMGVYTSFQSERALTAKDAPALKGCVELASADLKMLLGVDAGRVALAEGELPLSILPEVAGVRPDAKGELHAAWMAFPLPAGWKAERANGTLILTPDGLKSDETAQVFIVPDKVGQISFMTGAYTARNLLGEGADFAGVSQTGDLANGWNFYAQSLQVKGTGVGMLLQVIGRNTNQMVFVITVGNTAAVVNRTHATITDLLGKRGRITP